MSRLPAVCAVALLLSAFAAAPAEASIAPDGETTQARNASRGDTYRGTLAVRNQGTAVTTVKLYQTDYAFSADGRNSFDAPGGAARSNATWLRLNQEQVTIAPGRPRESSASTDQARALCTTDRSRRTSRGVRTNTFSVGSSPRKPPSSR